MDGVLLTVVEAQQRARVLTGRAGVAELADALDLKSRVPKGACGFDPRPRHQKRDTHRGASPWVVDAEKLTVRRSCAIRRGPWRDGTRRFFRPCGVS